MIIIRSKPLSIRPTIVFAIMLISSFQADSQSLDMGGDSLVALWNNTTPTWEQTIDAFHRLADKHEEASLFEVGQSDVGRPIHAFVVSNGPHAITSLASLEARRKSTSNRLCFMVNNAIHPGEPCGVDASIGWMREALGDSNWKREYLEFMDFVIIPMYNVGGALNRNCCSRTNQDGPEFYGFRGNGRNLDLNRDFIKMDSQNAKAFVDLFHAAKPDVFVDTHTTNGADYPYRMTLITTQVDKAGPVVGPFLEDVFEPMLFDRMEQKGEPVIPYVNLRDEIPENGIVGFLETPRYSTGYTTLFSTLGFTAEAHMLKPFPERVEATKLLLEEMSRSSLDLFEEIKAVREKEQFRLDKASQLPVRWELNEKDSTSLFFEGFGVRRELSAITKSPRLRYDRSEVWQDSISFWNSYETEFVTELPEFYVIPQAWHEVIDRLTRNKIEMVRFTSDTLLNLKVNYIESFHASTRAYEGHHMNRVDSIREVVEAVQLFKGDWMVPTKQEGVRFLAETLDPRAHDSYFTWNFFDSALQQKEYFSSYVFEDTAFELLQNDEVLSANFKKWKEEFPEEMNDPRAQLEWLYRQSPHFEGTVNRYPVFRSLNGRFPSP